MAVAAVWMTVLVPTWRQQAIRQKEEDLIFIGEQYARAIALYWTKNQGAYPPTVDVLVTQKFLRKKWKDPITNEDFLLVPAPPPPGQQQATPVGGNRGNTNPAGAVAPGLGQLTTGFQGVRSRSSGTSIKVYQNQQVYNMWPFDRNYACQLMGTCVLPNQQGQAPGRGGDGRGGRQGVGPGRGGPGGAPGRGAGPGRGVGPGRGGETGRGGPPPPPPPPGRGRGGY
jgi:hypothetical protein